MTVANRQPLVRNPPQRQNINRLQRMRQRLVETAPEFGNPEATSSPPNLLTLQEADGRYSQIP